MTSNTLFSPDLSFDPSCSGLREIREPLMGLVPLCLISLLWTLSSQRPYSWSCVCSKGSSGSLFPWTWNPDLHFWNKIWIIDSGTPISFSNFSLKSIPGYGLFTNVMMRLCNWRKCSWYNGQYSVLWMFSSGWSLSWFVYKSSTGSGLFWNWCQALWFETKSGFQILLCWFQKRA